MERTQLKGGSLSGTYLVRDGSETYVRKEISLTVNREFGYQRWYSQLKRLQRYSVLFPGLFPEVFRFGNHGDTAWFDMNYIDNAVTGHEYLMNASSEEEVEVFLEKLLGCFATMHKERIASSPEALRLYIQEEVERALALCMTDAVFKEFHQFDRFTLNGVEVEPLSKRLSQMIELAMKCYTDPFETFTHGNSTLENTLYIPSEKRLYFIDPYEETIVDSIYGEYSQVLQSSNSYYEIYNALPAVVKGNQVSISFDRNQKLDYFNTLFMQFLEKECSEEQMIVTRIFEISQFVRMLPFKMAVAPDKLIFFYAHASMLFQELMRDIGNKLR